MAGAGNEEIELPRSVPALIAATFALYRRFPWLFLILAGAVVVPYQLLVLLITGTGPFSRQEVGPPASPILVLTDFVLIVSLISALHVHAVKEIRDGNEPRLLRIARHGLAVLPAVSGVLIISCLGISVGLLALVIPGVILWCRWAVVAPVATLERKGVTETLRRSAGLADGHYRHVLGLLLVVGVPSFGLSFGLGRVFGHTETTVASFLTGTALQVLTSSFSALTTALLFYDLSARFVAEGKPLLVIPTSGPNADSIVGPDGQPLDPGSYSDEERPPGWYVDPDAPWRMRYWAADGKPGWSKRTAKTPKQTLAEWQDLRWVR